MGISPLEFQLMQERAQRGMKRQPVPIPEDAAERETGRGGLHDQIAKYCDDQWPRWKYIHSRTDKRSTIEEGAQDYTVFLPGGKTLCVELKSKTGKLSEAQIIWAKEMQMLGHTVYEVRSLGEFIELTKKP